MRPQDYIAAFPTPDSHYSNGGINYGSNGMSLRDYFAAKALQGLLADSTQRASMSEFSRKAYEHADSMLKAREVKL